MALIVCPDCGKEVSSSALACPKCGWQVNVAQAEPPRSKKRPWFLLILVILLAGWMGSQELNRQQKIEEQRQALARRLHPVVYWVIGARDQTGSVTYVDENGSIEQAEVSFSLPLPGSDLDTAGVWAKEFRARAGTALTLSAQNTGNSSGLMVKILVDGEEARSAKAEGKGSNASCEYLIP